MEEGSSSGESDEDDDIEQVKQNSHSNITNSFLIFFHNNIYF